MAENTNPTVREMIRGTLSHEVGGMIVNLGVQLANLDSALKNPGSPKSQHTLELDRARNEIRPSAKELIHALDTSQAQLSSTAIDPREIFSKNELVGRARNLLSKTSRMKDLASGLGPTTELAILVHRTTLNIERMIKISNSLFGDEEIGPPEVINPSTILKDIEVSTPPDLSSRVTIRRPSASTFLGYRRELISAASNLVRNGLRYSRPGELSRVRVDLSMVPFDLLKAEFSNIESILSRRISHHDWIYLSVTDTGKGIPSEHIGAVFKPFVRLDAHGKPVTIKDQDDTLPSVENDNSGQGFGLTLVKRVAEIHEGVAVARNGSEQGMIFAIVFPFKQKIGS